MSGRSRIRPKRPRKIYLAEHREAAGFSQKSLGEALRPKVSDMTVSRWENGKTLMSTEVMAAVAEVIGIEPEDLYYPPGVRTANAILRGQPEAIRQQAIGVLEALTQNRGKGS